MSKEEQTFIMVKPDGVQRGLIGGIIARFEKRGFKLVALKFVHPTPEHFENHYAEHKSKSFFPSLIQYMASGPVVGMVLEGNEAINTGRAMLGVTNPLASAPGTIRGDYTLAVRLSTCHASDSVDGAQKEIALWFPENSIQHIDKRAKSSSGHVL